MKLFNKEVKNPILFYLIAIFVFLNIMDIVTTMFIIEGESNPIYHLTGSIIPVILLKGIVLYFMIRWFIRGVFPSNFSYYFLITILVFGNLILLIAQIINIYAANNTEVLQAATELPVREKVVSYFKYINLFYFLPILLCLLPFYLYDKSKQKIVIDKEYFKRLPWWKV